MAISHTQKRLNKAWKLRHLSLAEFTKVIGGWEKTARFYQRMVEQGVTVALDYDRAPWAEIERRLAAGEKLPTVAISYGIVPGNLTEWLKQREKAADLPLARAALRVPFARWGELINNTTMGV